MRSCRRSPASKGNWSTCRSRRCLLWSKVATCWAVISKLASPDDSAAVENGFESTITQDILGKGDVLNARGRTISSVEGGPLYSVRGRHRMDRRHIAKSVGLRGGKMMPSSGALEETCRES